MDKIIGFSMTRLGNLLPNPPWLEKYPWLRVKHIVINGWIMTLWGHGDLSHFVDENRIVVGYSDTDLAILSTTPLENRGLVIELHDDFASVTNDTLGLFPVYYTSIESVPYLSTCEEVLLIVRGKTFISLAGLTSYLLYTSYVGTLTLWEGITKLYANRILRVTPDGTFEQLPQSPLEFKEYDGDNPIARIMFTTKWLVRKYTDPLDEVYLPLSSGQDSRLILANLQRPERVHARSYASSWPVDKSWEIVISKRSAELYGVTDHGILDFGRDYSKWTQDAIEYWGVPPGGTQVYLYAVSELMYCDGLGLPALSGVIGDVLAGYGVKFIQDRLGTLHNSYDLFRMSCYSQDKGWLDFVMDHCLMFDWRSAAESIKGEGERIWHETEGLNSIAKATLIRLRNHESQVIVVPWAALDIWGSIVPIYCDRDYIQFMLSLPYNLLKQRSGQQQMLATYCSKIWPHAGLDLSTMNCTNTMNIETIRNGGLRSIWPLTGDGLNPAHHYFYTPNIKVLENKALAGDEMTWFWLNSLQPIAWAIEKGYVSG